MSLSQIISFIDSSNKKRQLRLVPKCVKHGSLCDEKTFSCKKCDKELKA